MFLSPEIYIKQCQNYTKTYIFKIWYKVLEESEKLRFAPIIILIY